MAIYKYPGCQRFYFSFLRSGYNAKAKNKNLWSRQLRISLPCNFEIRYLAKPVFYCGVNVVPNSSPWGIELFDFDISHRAAANQSDMKPQTNYIGGCGLVFSGLTSFLLDKQDF